MKHLQIPFLQPPSFGISNESSMPLAPPVQAPTSDQESNPKSQLKLLPKRTRTGPPLHSAAGISVGCFIGTGYGLAVGVGRIRSLGSQTALVTPSATPFAHDGALTGAFCGVMVGAGFGSAVALHLGYTYSAGAYIQRQIQRIRQRLIAASAHRLIRSINRSPRLAGGRIPLPPHILHET